MKRKKLVSVFVIVMTVVILVSVFGCASKSETSTATQITATAQRGDVTVDISAVGNLAYAQEEELSFDIGGTVAEMLVEVGDSVTEGEVLARLDMTEWQQKIIDLESMLVTRQQALTQAEQNLTSAERNVTRQGDAVINAEKAVEDAIYNISVQERAVIQAQMDVTNAEINYQDLLMDFHFGTSNDYWLNTRIKMAEQNLELAKARLNDAYRNVEKAKETVTTAEKALENAKLDVIDARTAVTIAEASLTKAQQDVTDAQNTLDETKATHPEITAPFDGLIIAINTKAGSEIYKGGAVVTIVDSNKFKAEILVGEIDITDVRIDGDATVELDALSGIIIPAKVTSISPTATVTQGVVSYQVTVELSSQQYAQPGLFQSGSDLPFTPGEMPEGMKPGQRGAGGLTKLSVQLRQGLTATVSIIIDQVSDVIYVPNQAVTSVQGISTVNVTKDGEITERTVTIGISNSKFTEIIEGLAEGEQVVYTRSSSSSDSMFGPGGGTFFMGR